MQEEAGLVEAIRRAERMEPASEAAVLPPQYYSQVSLESSCRGYSR